MSCKSLETGPPFPAMPWTHAPTLGRGLPPALLTSHGLHTQRKTRSTAHAGEHDFKYFFCSFLPFPPGIHVTHMLHFL